VAKKKARKKKRSPAEAKPIEPKDPDLPESEVKPAPALPRSRKRLHALLAMAAGAMQCLGFAGFSLWPFALICFVPMFYVLHQERESSGKRILWLGWLHGFTGYAGGFYWLVETLDRFGGFPTGVSFLFASIFFAFQGLQQMLLYWLVHRGMKRGQQAWVMGVPALITLEHVFPALFPQYLANGFHEVPITLQLADLGGPMLVSAVIMLVNCAVWTVVHARMTKAPFPRLPVGLAAGCVALALGYGAWRIAEVDARIEEAETLRVGVVHPHTGITLDAMSRIDKDRRFREQSRRLEREEAGALDLLIWPESAYSLSVARDGDEFYGRRVHRGQLQTPLLFGAASVREVDGEPKAYNTAFLVDGSGRVLSTYDKTYLLAFGEYLPFGETFPVLYEWSPNSGRFTPGDHVRPVELDGVRISVLICYEDVLPGFTRQAVSEGNPHLLVNITQDGWFGDTQEPGVHLALAKFRAIEHHRTLARSTNDGVTAFVDPVGRVIDELGPTERGEIVGDLPLLTGSTLYQHLGDWPGWAALLAIGWLCFWPNRRLRGT